MTTQQNHAAVPAAPRRICLHCGKECTLKCSQCHAIHFCDRDCQMALWKSHKRLCQALASVAVPPSTTSTTGDDDTNTSSNNGGGACLIVDGLGPLGAGWDYMKGCRQHLQAINVPVAVFDATRGEKIPEQIASALQMLTPSTISSVVVLGWGAGDHPLTTALGQNEDFRESVVQWVQQGGNLLVQGERIPMCGNWPTWFGYNWTSPDYRRTDHTCFATSAESPHWCQWYRNAPNAVLGRYNVKAVMLRNVEPHNVLFGSTEESRSYSLVPSMRGEQMDSGLVAVALAQYGEGTVSFFGDVNFEDPTLQIIAIVARGNPTNNSS